MRIGGIASGFDTEQIVKDLMRAERMPLDRLFQSKARAELQRDAYRDVNNMLRRLQEKSFDMRLQGSYSAWQATSSHENIATVTTTGRSQEGSFDLNVKQLAASASWTSTVDTTTFETMRPAEGETKTLRLRSELDGDFVEITINAEDSLKDVFAKMNRSGDLGMQVFYDEGGGVSFRSRATGEQSVIEFDHTDVTSHDFFNSVLSAGAPADGHLAVGSNAELTVNGLDITRSGNTFEIDGTSLTLHAVSADAAAVTTVQVQADVDAVYDRISEFVDLYNEVVLNIHERLNEPVHRDFPPLTDEQREAMSDREVELWEEKAHSGMLRNDRMLSSVLTNLRMAWSSPVEGMEGDVTMFSQIGISTGSWFERGVLHIDEGQLKGAIRDNADAVMQLFTKSATEEGSNSQMGIARRLDTSLRAGMDRVTRTAGRESSRYDQSFLGNQIRRYEERLDAMEERMLRVEARYWSQFTNMERMLSDMYAQSDWLGQQLMGMMG